MENTRRVLELMTTIKAYDKNDIPIINSYSDIFCYNYLEVSLHNMHPLNYIWYINSEICYELMICYKWPLQYLLNKIADLLVSDDQTVYILQKYMAIYNNVVIYDEFRPEGESGLIAAFAENEYTKSLKYLLDMGVTYYHDTKTIYDLDMIKLLIQSEKYPDAGYRLIYNKVIEINERRKYDEVAYDEVAYDEVAYDEVAYDEEINEKQDLGEGEVPHRHNRQRHE